MLTDVYSKSHVSLQNTHVPTLALIKPAKIIISSNTAKLLFKKNEQPLLRTMCILIWRTTPLDMPPIANWRTHFTPSPKNKKNRRTTVSLLWCQRDLNQ